ncbi:MAG TPA: dienelactone hydrolase family protein [Chthoniobacterales bacterium]|nr:dienelactone hydrolase family protein [Chthoniobacterales bacterium]
MSAAASGAETETLSFAGRKLEFGGATRESEERNVVALKLHTDRGDIDARFHPSADAAPAAKQLGVVWVGGAGGGLDGPARGLYPAASEQLQQRGIASIRLHYRRPNELRDCVLDTLAGVAFLAREGVTKVALVGHSFGGAVVISAGASSKNVKAVVPMSSQTYGTELTPAVAPRAMLLIHGTNDEVLPDACSRQIYAAAGQPKEIKLYPGAGHGLDEVRQEVLDLLVRWIPEQVAK